MTGKTVAEKARIKAGSTIGIINAVQGVVVSLGLPQDVRFVEPDEAQLVFLFVRSRAELDESMPSAVESLAPGSAIWVFFQKGSKSAHRDMNRDDVWALAERLGMRPLGLVGVDETWSAFRLRMSQ